MTLDESKMEKMLVIKGTFSDVPDLTELWYILYPMGELKLSGTVGNYSISYKGEMDKGLYALGLTVEAIRKAKGECHLEVGCEYK